MKQTCETTKDRILDAAEKLFADNGFHATSLRDITARAQVNLAAVNYHFQSKEALIQAVVLRKIAPINQQRMVLLDNAEAISGDHPITLEQILHAFLAPLLLAEEHAVFVRLLARVYNEPGDLVHRCLAPAVAEVVARFGPAIQQAVSGADRRAISVAMMFAVGSTAHYLAVGPMLDSISQGAASHQERAFILDCLVRYSAAGLRALVQSERENSR
jgi:AcrR family transcriptional regulator